MIKGVEFRHVELTAPSKRDKKGNVAYLYSARIEFDDPQREDVEILLGIKPRSTLKFVSESYFGVISEKILELWDAGGVLLSAIPVPLGKFVDIFEDQFVYLYKDELSVYDKLGEIVAIGKRPEEGDLVMLERLDD